MSIHAKRNRLLLALFFGVLSVCFGATAAEAASLQCNSGTMSGNYYDSVPQTWVNNTGNFFTVKQLNPPAQPSSGTASYVVGDDPCNPVGYSSKSSTGTAVANPSTAWVPGGQLWRMSTTTTIPAASSQTEESLNPPPPPPPSSTDPLDGTGMQFAADSVSIFSQYVVPAVAAVILMVYVWRMTVKLGTRFLNRA